MKLNGETIKDVSSTSLLTSGLNAKSGTELQSWTIHTKLIDDITSIGLIGPTNVQGPIQYQLYDSFDNVVQAIGQAPGDIVPIKGEYIEKIVITGNTSDNLPPKNLKVVINGCFKEELLRTKAQVEHRTTFTGKQKLNILFIILSFLTFSSNNICYSK
jgi:hypothetical protein